LVDTAFSSLSVPDVAPASALFSSWKYISAMDIFFLDSLRDCRYRNRAHSAATTVRASAAQVRGCFQKGGGGGGARRKKEPRGTRLRGTWHLGKEDARKASGVCTMPAILFAGACTAAGMIRKLGILHS